LIVIAILGILAAAVLVAINPAKRTNQARDAGRKNDIGSLAVELQAYYTTPGAGEYPGDLNVLTSSGGLKQVPNDPLGPAYTYVLAGDSSESAVYSSLQDPTGTLGFWCWMSFTNVATEFPTTAECSAP